MTSKVLAHGALALYGNYLFKKHTSYQTCNYLRVCLIFLNFIVLHFLQIIYIMHTSCYYYFPVTAWKHSKKWCSLKIKVYIHILVLWGRTATYVSLGWEGIGFQTIFVIFHVSSCIVNFGNGCKWSEAIPKMKNTNANESLGLMQAIKCNVGMLAIICKTSTVFHNSVFCIL